MDIQDMKEQRQAFDEWHYNQYLLENPNIDTSSAKYIYDYAHKNVLVWQIRESHFTAWQAAKAQAVQAEFEIGQLKDRITELLDERQDLYAQIEAQTVPEGFVLVNKKDLVKVLNCVTDDWLVDTDSFEEFKKIESLVQDEVNAMIDEVSQ